MLLILSARMVNEDIALHYGRLPPSFLPLGNRRLFAYQAELGAPGPVAMTVPSAFEISDIDAGAIEKLGIRLLPQPPGLSLTEAIYAAIETLDPQTPLRLLYGDTLVRIPEGTESRDRVVVQKTNANYPWAFVTEDDSGQISFSDAPPKQLEQRRVVCGDYSFTDPDLLKACCKTGNITDALNAYHGQKPFEVVEASDWYDFGHLPLYFQSKKSIMIKRDFNSLTYEDHNLLKQSDDTDKMRAEAHWYESIPASLKLHTPRYSGRVERNHQAGYAIEYLFHPLVSDLAAFGDLPLSSWLEILNACFEFADKCQSIHPDPGAPEASPAYADHFFQEMIVGKTWARLETYLADTPHSLDDCFTISGTAFPPLSTVVGRVIDAVPATEPHHVRFWHGDMFFGNMFYDFTARRAIAIDPRGQLSPGRQSLFGDWRYDMAKLAHSVIGQYDKIILGRSTLIEHDPRTWDLTLSEQPHQVDIERIFMQQVINRYGMDPDTLLSMTALLFFSMLPLHRDRPDLQKQMLANALRLSAQVKGVLE